MCRRTRSCCPTLWLQIRLQNAQWGDEVPRQPIDWNRYRDLWVQRNLRDPAYSLKELARDQDLSYGVVARKARVQGWRTQLDAQRAAIAERVSAEVRERTAIDQVEARLKHARIGDLVEPVLRASLEHLAEDARRDPGTLSVKDTVALGRLWTRLMQVGAGLPRVHDGVVQEVPEEVAVNRRMVEQAKSDVVDFARWRKQRGLVPPKWSGGSSRNEPGQTPEK